MANSNNESVDNNPDTSRDSGLDKSFMGKFVSGLLNNTPLSKWFGKESIIRKREDDDDELNASYTFQPPVKRAKLPSSSEHNNYSAHVLESPVTVRNASNNINNVNKVYAKFPEPIPGPSGIRSRRVFEKHNTSSTVTVSSNSFENEDVVNGEQDSDSEESTSGYYSAPKLVNKQKDLASATASSDEGSEKSTKSRSLFTSTDDTRQQRSLFTERSPQMNTSLSSRRPTFNASTFGSPNFIDKTLSTKRIMSSPFYSGNTIYGGSSAYGRRFGKHSEDVASRLSVQIKPVNEKPKKDNASLSKTARRILSTLEQYSTPISDAKKIPVTPGRHGILSKFVGATPYLVRDKVSSNIELQVPDLIQMKQKERLQSVTETVRQIASKSKSVLNKEEYKLRTDDDNKQKHSNKMKNSIASARPKIQSNEPVSEVNLPKVSLPITTLPKFDFVLMPPATSDSSKRETKKTPVDVAIKTVYNKKETDKKIENCKTDNYTFSEPVIISKDVISASINCFKFSEPVCKKQRLELKQTESIGKLKNNGDIAATKLKSLPGNAKATWECPTCLVRNSNDRVKCEACEEPKPESQPKKPVSQGFGDQFKLSGEKWECSSCLVRNNNSDKICVACTTARPATASSGFGDEFKPPPSTWECSSCLVRNKNELKACQACGSSPTAKGDFGDKFKPPSDTWECQVCMIRNKKELDKCQACETPKPANDASKLTQNTSFNFGITPKNDGFGDAFKTKAGEWECSSCLVKNKPAVDTCVCCGVVKPGASGEKISKESNPVVGFNFGVGTPATAFKFGISATKENSLGAVTSTIPAIVGIASKPDTVTSSSFTFGINAQEKIAPVTTITSNENVSSTVVTNPLLKPSEKLPEKAVPAPVGFKFGLDSTITPKPVVSNENLVSSTSKTEAPKTTSVFSSSFETAKSTPSFSFKPTAVNGDINKPKEVATGEDTKPKEGLFGKPKESPFSSNKPKENVFGVNAQQPKEVIFGTDSNKPKEGMFSSEPNKPKEGLFSSNVNKPKPGLFAPDANVRKDNLFSNSFTKPKDVIFANEASKPFGGDNKPKEPIFGGDMNKTKDMFGGDANKPKPFGTDLNKPKETIFGGDASKPKELMFGGDINKPKDLTPFDTKKPESMFGGKPPESTSFFANTSTPPTFKFNSKPLETTAPKAQPGIFKFGGETQPQAPPMKPFGSQETSVSNGFGTVAKIPAFGYPQPFGTTERKPFAFGDADSTPKNTFSFGQPAKADPANPVFNFGGNPSPAPNNPNFNFAAPTPPSTGFNFGAAPKIENPAFGGGANNVFGSGPSAAKNGTFNFGPNANNNAEKAIFSFGASQPNPPSQPSFLPQPSQAGFNFAPAAAAVPPSGGFNFTGTPSFNYTDGSSATAPSQRKFKKALRRTNR